MTVFIDTSTCTKQGDSEEPYLVELGTLRLCALLQLSPVDIEWIRKHVCVTVTSTQWYILQWKDPNK